MAVKRRLVDKCVRKGVFEKKLGIFVETDGGQAVIDWMDCG